VEVEAVDTVGIALQRQISEVVAELLMHALQPAQKSSERQAAKHHHDAEEKVQSLMATALGQQAPTDCMLWASLAPPTIVDVCLKSPVDFHTEGPALQDFP